MRLFEELVDPPDLPGFESQPRRGSSLLYGVVFRTKGDDLRTVLTESIL